MEQIDPVPFFLKCGLPEPVREYKFCETRGWRFDFAWPDKRVALENDGGVHIGGRHTSPKGFREDQHKRNEAVALGWRVLHATPQGIKSLATVSFIKRTLAL